MSVTKIDPFDTWSAPAAEDLSSHQFYMVKVTSEGKLALAGADERSFALQDAPKEGEYGTIAVPGPIVKAPVGAPVNAGELLTSNAEGRPVKAEAGDAIIGTALTSADAAGVYVTFTSNPGGAKA